MVRSDLSSVLQYIRGLAAADKLGSVSDRQLLRRFVDCHEEAAFATLLQRHGPMVLGLCRRVLRQTQDAEDAFQATFLLLARGAGGIRNPDAVGGWLHGVALRVASKLRAKAARQSKVRSEEGGVRSEKTKFNSSLLTPPSSHSADDPIEEATWKEFRVVLDEELDRLPIELRAPLVLCYLEGRTQDEGARQLGWSRRVFRRRLEKGRARMARRLARRGITLSTALFAILLSQEAPAMTAALWLPALQAALAVTTGRAAGGISATALGLAEGFVPPLVMSKGKWVLALLLCLNLAGTGLGIVVAWRAGNQPPQVGQASRLSQASADRRDAGPTPPTPADAAAPKGVELVGTTAVLNGCVRDASGRAVPQARLVVLARRRYRPGEHGLRQEVLHQGQTDADGRFRLMVPADFPTWYAERQVVVAASAPGHAPGTLAVPLRAGQPFLSVTLAANRPLRGRLTDRDANPVVGVRLEVVRLGNVLREVIQTTDQGPSTDAPVDLWPAAATTNAAGEFEFPGLGTVRNVWLQIHDDRFAIETWPAEFSDGRPIDGQPYGIMVVPGQVLQGTVTAADTGKPIPHARLTAVSPNEWTAAPRYALHTVAQEAAPRAPCSEFDARADAAGRFRLRLPTGRFFRLEAHAPPGSAYLALSRAIDRKDNGDLQRINFALPRGLQLTARVHDAATDQPVGGAVAYYVPDRDNQRAGGDVLHGCDAHALSGADGRVRLALPSGRGRLCVHAPDSDFLSQPYRIQGEADGRVSYAHAIRALDLPADGGAVEMDVPLQKGVSLTGKVVGPDGRPVAAGILISARHVHPLNPSTARPLPLSGGEFVLPGCEPGRTYPVLILDAERRLGAAADLTAGPREQPAVIRLQPCGRATVRFVNAEGRPLANQVLTPFVLLEPDRAVGGEAAQAVPHEMAWADPWVYHHCLGPHTESDGCITLTGLVPGVRYGLTQWDGFHHRRVLDSLTIRPGETLRLPDAIVPSERE